MPYRVVESTLKEEWDVELFDCEYDGCILHINYVSVEEDAEKTSAVLKFDYDILNDFVPHSKQEFEQYVGDMILHMISDGINHMEAKENLEKN